MRILDVMWIGLLAIILTTNTGCSNSEPRDPGSPEVVATKNRESEARNGVKDAESLVELGISKLEKAPPDFAGAVSDFDKAILLKPSLPSAYFNRGFARWNLGELEAALADFTQEIQLDPRAVTYTFRGRVKYELGDLSGAMVDLDHAVGLDPTNSLAFFQRGSCKRELEDYRGAIEDFGKAIQNDPSMATAYFYRANTKKTLSEFSEAISDYSEAIRLNPQYDTAYVGRGLAKKAIEDFRGAIEDFDEALRQKPDVVVCGFRAMASAELGSNETALEFLDTAVMLDPNHAHSYLLRGQIKNSLSDFEGALKDFDAAIQLAPSDAEAYRDRSCVKEKQNDYEGAFADLERSIQIEPSAPESFFIRGCMMNANRKYSQAVADFDMAISLGDPNIAVILKLSFLLSTCPDDSVRDSKRAEKLALEALKRMPDNPYALSAHACSLAAEGDFKLAIEWERKAMASPVYLEDDDLDGGKHSDDRIKKWEAKRLWLTPTKL